MQFIFTDFSQKGVIFLKSKVISLILLIYILVLTGCTYTGRNDLGLYINNYNSACPEDLQIKEENLVLHTDEKTKENTYYIFYPTGEDGEYMITLNENVDGDIYKCGICIISSIDVEPQTIEDIFISESFALKNLSTSSAKQLFEDLKLDKKDTYTKTNSTAVETDEYTVELIVNQAGTGIYIY